MSGLRERVAAFAARWDLSREAVKELTTWIEESSPRVDISSIGSGVVPAAGFVEKGRGGASLSSTAAGTDATTPPDFPSDRYESQGALGAGGMGEVFRVRERSLNRLVALKVLRRDLSGRASSVARFIREAQLNAQLQHPGIVPVYEIGQLADGRPFFTMREVHGQTLRDAIASTHTAIRNGEWHPAADGWSLRRLLEAFHRVCEAIAYAHARGVVHRDLKPQNIMLGDYGEVLVLDWGIAKLVAQRAANTEDPIVTVGEGRSTRSGAITGTPAYMAPEQARGDLEAIGPHSDVFALGAVLHEILWSQPPSEVPTLDGSTPNAPPVRRTLQSLTFPASPPIPEELVSICQRALSPDGKARYRNAQELAVDMGEWLEGAKNLTRAREILGQAARGLQTIEQVRGQARGLREQADKILASMPAFVPTDAKSTGWLLEDQAAALEKDADAQTVRFRQMVWSALTLRAELPEAHRLLADHYAKEHARAESSGLEEEANKLEVLLRDHDRGLHAKYLKGDGTLSLRTDPSGAIGELHRYVLRDRRLQLEHVRTLGATPFDQIPLPMGSYLIVLRAEGRQEVRYPVAIRRMEHWNGVSPEGGDPTPVYLPLEGELAADEVYVPPGWFWSGGDAGAIGRRSVMPRRRLWLDGFAVRRYQVTIGEYVDFLNGLVREGREEEALIAAPRVAGRLNELGTLLLDRTNDGTFVIPPNNYFGIPWQGVWPTIFVDWYGAMAYTRFKASQAKASFRLPTELEWEKAARGVDGRRFPWGDFLDPTWCRMLETHAGLPTMAPAGSYEIDESVFGVRDMAGNQRDWCLDIPSEQGPPLSPSGRVLGYLDSHEAWNVRVARGGNFLDSPLWCWTYHRSSFLPHVRDYTVSFRTARSIGSSDPRPVQLPAHPQGPTT